MIYLGALMRGARDCSDGIGLAVCTKLNTISYTLGMFFNKISRIDSMHDKGAG